MIRGQSHSGAARGGGSGGCTVALAQVSAVPQPGDAAPSWETEGCVEQDTATAKTRLYSAVCGDLWRVMKYQQPPLCGVTFLCPQSSPRGRIGTDGAVLAMPGASLNPVLPCQHVNISPCQKTCLSPQIGTVASPRCLGTRGLELHEACSCGSRRTKLSSSSQLFFQAYISSAKGYGVKCPHTARCRRWGGVQ